MTRALNLLLLSHDEGLIAHWTRAFGKSSTTVIPMDAVWLLPSSSAAVVWVDLSLPALPGWESEKWQSILRNENIKVVAGSSNPNDPQGMHALDAGCAAYCHAFSDAATLKQVRQVVEAGNVWIGKSLMQRLLQGVNRAAPTTRPTKPETADNWSEGLTPRERQVAILAANGASNQRIAVDCSISERTVKAHLSAVFDKLNITDRLQLALRVHGIQ